MVFELHLAEGQKKMEWESFYLNHMINIVSNLGCIEASVLTTALLLQRATQ